MPPDKKTVEKGKGIAQPQPAAPVALQPKQITIQLPTLTLDFGPNFQFKLAVLAFAILLFAFALFLFARSNFATSDIFDYSRIEFNAGKLYSLNFLLFLFLYSLSMALVIAYGLGLPKLQAAIPLVVLFFVAMLESIFFGPYRAAFLGFGLALGAAAIAASFSKELTPSAAWNITSKALTVLVMLSFVFTYMHVEANKERYFNTLILGVVNQAPELLASAAPAGAQQAVNFCADLIGSAKIKRDQVQVIFTKDAFAANLDAQGGPVYSALPAASKQLIVDSTYDYSIDKSVEVAGKLQSDFAKVIRSIDAGKQIASANVTQFVTPDLIKKQLQAVPQTRLLYNYLGLLAALTIAGVVGMVNLFIHVLATIMAWVLAKFVLS